MPRKSIKVVNLSEPSGEASESSPSHPEAQGMNEILSEMKDEVPAEMKDEVPAEPVVPKPKRKPRTKKDVMTPVEEKVAEPVEEKVAESVEGTKQEKVPCPDCGKMVSAKTLKYTHKNTCKSKQHVHSGVCYDKYDPSADMVEEEISKRLSCARQMRTSRRSEKIAKLAAAAF